MTFRAPIFHRIPARFAAQPEYIVNLNPLLNPNPSRPFNQSDWPRTKDPLWKVTGEVVGTLNALLTPNPSVPNNQYEWRSPSRIPLSLKSDAYSWVYPLYEPNPSRPFNLLDWPRPFDPKAKAAGEALSGDAPLLTPNPAQPFGPFDWFQIAAPRKAIVDDFVNLPTAPVVVVVNPFIQDDWVAAVRALSPLQSEVYNAPLLLLYPAQPFFQDLWELPVNALPKSTAEPFWPGALYMPTPPPPPVSGLFITHFYQVGP